MHAAPIGTLREIYRYPVKSLAGERIGRSRIESYGLYGDRCYAFRDETKSGWEGYITARSIPRMLAYRARLVEEEASRARAENPPAVEIFSPDGQRYTWGEALRADLQQHARCQVSLLEAEPDAAGLLAVDAASVLLITDASLRRLQSLWGRELDPRRFRANLILTAADDAADERSWIGRRLAIGDAELRIDEPCERCSLITLDPDTQERDASLLKRVNEAMGLTFGVYAAVVRTGTISAGDAVHLLD